MLVARGGALGASFPAHPEPICAQRAELGTASSDHGLCWSKVFPPPTKPARPPSTQQSPMGCCGHSHLVCKVSPAARAPATCHTLGNNTTIIKCPRGTRGSGSSHREHLLQEEPQEKELSMGGTLSIPSWPGGGMSPALPWPRLWPEPSVPAEPPAPAGIQANTSAGKCTAVVLEINN